MADTKKTNYGYQPEKRGYQPGSNFGNGYQPTTEQGGGNSVPPSGGSSVKAPQTKSSNQ